MRFILTRNLRPIDTDDEDGFTYTNDVKRKLFAIRSLDRDLIRGIESDLFSYLLVHEMLHSFIKKGVPFRNEKILALGKLIFSIFEGEQLSQTDFNATLEFVHAETVLDEDASLFAFAADSQARSLTEEDESCLIDTVEKHYGKK
ncbi:MAG: hypothetical protein KA715_08960 [Xanthomonadaceae bacterium]|nr:hypothetical protein [Xanthomonadaceae bacterium]